MSPSIISTLLGKKKIKAPDSAITIDEGVVGCMYAPKLTSLDYNLNLKEAKTPSRNGKVSAIGGIQTRPNSNGNFEIKEARHQRVRTIPTASKAMADIYSPIYLKDNTVVDPEEDTRIKVKSGSSPSSKGEFDQKPLIEKTGGIFTFQKVVKTVILYLVGLLVFFGMIIVYILSLFYRQFVKIILVCIYGDRVWLIQRPADALWGYETDSSSSNIVYVLKCKGVPDINRIVDDFERKVLKYRTLLRADGNADGIYHMYTPYKKLSWIVREKLLFYCWERDDDFNVRNHFFMEKVMDEGNNVNERIEAVCEAYLEYKLDPTKPQWEFRVIAPVGGEGSTNSDYGLIFCVHHSYGDGVSWLQMFRHCLADEPVKLPIDPMKTPLQPPSSRSERFTAITNILETVIIILSLPFAFSFQMARMAQESHAFHGPFVSGSKRCQWTKSTMSLENIKSIKQRNGNSVLFTTVVLACAVKAFQRSFHHAGARIPMAILSGVPYAKLPYKSFEPLNSFTMAIFPLPTRILYNRNLRLGLTDKITREYSSKRHAAINNIFTNMAGSLITPLFKLSTRVAKSTMGMTNLPGPNETLYLFGGHCVNNLIIYAPMKFRTGVNIGVFSYCGKVTLSLAVDSTVSERHAKFAELFIQYLEKEMEVIVDECGFKKDVSIESSNNHDSSNDDKCNGNSNDNNNNDSNNNLQDKSENHIKITITEADQNNNND